MIKFTVIYENATGEVHTVEPGKAVLRGINQDLNYLWTSDEIADVIESSYGIEQVRDISISNISEISDQQFPS